jgi:aryl-alcohol dehydrogenase-like predicted oxidoreductase
MKAVNKLGLGTAQWGLPYGVSNQQGLTPTETVTAILAEADRRGISVLDTAALYGEAEAVLGANSLRMFRVISKTERFATSAISDDQASQLAQTFHRSLQRLSSPRIYGLLLHHAEDLLVPGGKKLLAAMSELKERGYVDKIGVSVYDGEQLDAVLKIFKPDIVQLPISVFDQRMLLNGQLERLKRDGVEIHTRSAFLQGLLLMPLNKIPAYFDPVRPQLARWHAAAEEQGMTRVQAALAFVRDIAHVDTVLVGVESLAQFQSCLEDFVIEASFDASSLDCRDPKFVNPVHWRV